MKRPADDIVQAEMTTILNISIVFMQNTQKAVADATAFL